MKLRNTCQVLLITLIVLLVIGCSSFPKPDMITSPEPIMDNSEEFYCPYTQDGTIAEWVDIGMKASAATKIGKAAGRIAGRQLVKKIPFVGGLLGSKVGGAIGRSIAIKSSGGWEKIKATSEMSFTKLPELAVWMYVNKSLESNYRKVLKLVSAIYPKLKKKYRKYIKKEYKRQKKARKQQRG